MRIIVLGGGVIGVTTAYELLKDGHEVTLVEREADVALGTSFANAGMIAPGHAFAWASPRAPKILLKSLWRDDQPLRFRLSADPALLIWSARFLRECTAERALRNTRRKHSLCRYSQQVLREISSESGIAYDASEKGLIYFHRRPETLERGIANMKFLRDLGQEQEILDRNAIAKLDPALEPVKHEIAGGIYAPTDSVGDARKFTRELANLVESKGGQLLLSTQVNRLETDRDRVISVDTDRGKLKADAFVVALGVYSPHLVRDLGYRLPVYPVKGYSLTLPINKSHLAPTIGGVDEDNLIAYSRMGDRLRVTATAEFAGYNVRHKPSDFAVMLRKIQELLPRGADYAQPNYWAGLRPMTPEGTPILGTGLHTNLYFNTGHGHVGWTMACGSARITRHLISQREPEISLEGMTLQ